MIVEVTRQNQQAWTRRALSYRTKGQLQGQLVKAEIPIGHFVTIEKNGLGDMVVIDPHAVVHPKCPKCAGRGFIPEFNHIQEGNCFACKGKGSQTGEDVIRNLGYVSVKTQQAQQDAQEVNDERSGELDAEREVQPPPDGEGDVGRADATA